MKYLVIALIIGTTLISAKSKIVNSELILDTRSECKKSIDEAREVFSGHTGDYYSVMHKGKYALKSLDFGICRDFSERRERDQLKAEIQFAMGDVEKDSFRPGHVGPKKNKK